MKNTRFYIKLLLTLGLLLLFITVGQSYFEYRSSQAVIIDLFKSQSETLIGSITRAGEKGLIAYQSLQEQVVLKLFAIARLSNQNQSSLEKLADENDIAEIIVFNRDAGLIVSYPPSSYANLDTTFINGTVIPFSQSANNTKVIGFINSPVTDNKLFAILYKKSNNQLIFIGTNAEPLQNQRRAFGTGSIIEDLASNTGIVYAGIFNNAYIIAATKNFPVSQMDDWYIEPEGMENPENTRIRSITFEENSIEDIFEAKGAFDVAGQYYGEIVIGLDTGVLTMLGDKLKRDVFWHSILGLMITLIAVIGAVIWNNYRMISRRYDEIKGEVQKLEADKAIKARLASMGELAGGVAHEIRNPLNAIRVIVQRLQREFTPKADNDEYLELTNVVKRETDRINESIEQFLKMARPPALQKSKGDFNRCLDNIIELFASRAANKKVQITRDFSILPEANFDSSLCRQAILNILENALDALGENGNIDIRTYSKDRRAYIEIADNGPGISDELKSRIFDMYFTTKDSGTGMGLPSVLMTVKEHGGTVDVLDNPGGGAIFRLEFPLE